MEDSRWPLRYRRRGGVVGMTRTSSNIFRARLEFLVEERGIAQTARFYGRSPRTVRRWLGGEATPSQSIRESVRRRGLTAGAPQSQQVRTGGRFTAEGTIARGGSLNAVTAINRRMRRVRDAEIRRARRAGDERQLRAARTLPTRMTRTEADSIALRRERLINEQPTQISPQGEIISGVPDDVEEYGMDFWDDYPDEYDSWEAWRSSYAERAG